jgi:biotin carboxylase
MRVGGSKQLQRGSRMTGALLYINGRKNRHERLAEVLAAHRLGFDVVLLADVSPAIGLKCYRHVEVVDTQDVTACLAVVDRLKTVFKFAGVVNWSETDVLLRHTLARYLELPGMSADAALRCRDKVKMKKALASFPDVLPRFASISSRKELDVALSHIGYPSVLKPAGGSGSKGIFVLQQERDVDFAFGELSRIVQSDFDRVFTNFEGKFILEEYLDGPEVSVEGLVGDDGVEIVGITDKWTTYPFSIEVRHVFPSNKPQDLQEEIRRKTEIVVSALGIRHSVFHLEGRCTRNGFRLIECAARPAGDYITTHLLPLSMGGEHLENCLRVTAKLPIVKRLRPLFYSTARFLLAPRPGRFAGIGGIDRMVQSSLIEHIFVHASRGDEIQLPPTDFAGHRVGVIIARGENYRELVSSTEEVAAAASVSVH